MESLEDKVLSSGCALGKQRSANNQCPSLGGRGRERAGNVCKGSLRPGRRGLLLFLIITAIQVLSLGSLGRCSQGRRGEEAKGPGGTCCTATPCSACADRALPPGAKRGSLPPSPPRGRISLKDLCRVASP